MSHNNRHDRVRGSSSENIPQRASPEVGAAEPRRRSQTADPALARRTVSAHLGRAVLGSARRTDIVRVEEHHHGRYVSVRVEQLEDALAEHRVLRRNLAAMVSEELKAQILFEQLKSQLRRAGMTFAQDSLPYHPRNHHPDQRAIVPGRHGTREATVPVQSDKLEAALVRLSMTKADPENVTCNERELRITIAQAQRQLRRAGIIPSQDRNSLKNITNEQVPLDHGYSQTPLSIEDEVSEDLKR